MRSGNGAHSRDPRSLRGAVSRRGSGLLLAILSLGALAFALMGCTAGASITDVPVSRQAAIDTALEAARTSRPELGASQVEPTLVTAELLTLADARARLQDGAVGVGTGGEDRQLVWLVILNGAWVNQPPGQSNTPAPLATMALLIDAQSGREVEGYTWP